MCSIRHTQVRGRFINKKPITKEIKIAAANEIEIVKISRKLTH